MNKKFVEVRYNVLVWLYDLLQHFRCMVKKLATDSNPLQLGYRMVTARVLELKCFQLWQFVTKHTR